ncbi:MAG: regulator of sigma protease [Patescibacteria group bacterium]|nr:regulator of sigma protease [Patescibacteria group bacterium]
MLNILNIIITLVALNILMVAHEFGHFLMAKLFKVKVEEFNVGFPPTIFSFMSGGVKYALNAIPFGAYVKLSEEEGKPESFLTKKNWQKAGIFIGGVALNALIAIVIMCFLFNTGFPKVFLPNISQAEAEGFVSYPLGQALRETFNFLNYVLVQSLLGFKTAFIKIITKLDVNDLVGPVGLFALTSRGFELGWRYGLYLIALISYALAIFNLLPIPAVDGGQLFFLLIGVITRKPIPKKVEVVLDNLVLVALMFLAILVTIKDFRFFY